MEKYISAYIIIFFIYGFAGWIWESFICPLATGYAIKNSGFLNGPIVPIYGVGALSVSLLFSSQETYLSIFIEGAFVACVIEYLTSWAMEKLYHRRWWDYSDKAFNVNGRVCLEGFLIFGIFSIVAVKFVSPLLLEKLLRYNMVTLIIAATALTTILLIDLVFTIIALAHLEERLDLFRKDMEKYAQKFINDVEENKHNFNELMKLFKENDQKAYRQWFREKKFNERRIIKAFPQLMNHSNHQGEKQHGKK